MILEQMPLAASGWLRSRVLTPHLSPAQVIAADDPGALQIAALHERQIIACANVRPEAAAWSAAPGWWRMRGVAVDPDFRRQGLGSAVVTAVCDLAKANGATLMWCNARSGAITMYESLGWIEQGSHFVLPEIGEHVQMWRQLGT